MTTTKNPGLGARMSAIDAALDSARTSTAIKASEPETSAPVTALSVRLPKPMYDALLDIVHGAKKRGEKVSIHSLMLEGIATVINEREATTHR